MSNSVYIFPCVLTESFISFTPSGQSGILTLQPNNRCRAFEPSFVTKPGQNLIERKLGTQMWSVENTAKWVLSDDDRYDYEVKEKK